MVNLWGRLAPLIAIMGLKSIMIAGSITIYNSDTKHNIDISMVNARKT